MKEYFEGEKFLYYFGAGASYNALPLARSSYEENSQVPKIKGLAYELERIQYCSPFLKNLEGENESYFDDIINNCKELALKANEFGDVDTYAKYLQLMGEKIKLNKLKKH